LTLERVLGLTAYNNAGLTVNNVTGEVAYPAGCVVVVYNFRRDKQTRYYRVEKPVSAIAFSPDGSMLAIGEKGPAPSITVWDVQSGSLKADFKRHKYGVAALAFGSRYLMSVGVARDGFILAWCLDRHVIVGGVKLEANTQIHAIDYSLDGRFFVTAGDQHVHVREMSYLFISGSSSSLSLLSYRLLTVFCSITIFVHSFLLQMYTMSFMSCVSYVVLDARPR
jgi:WD40 repeat protein